MKLTRPQIIVLIVAVTVLLGFVTNVASNQLPERWKPYLWLSWPLFVLLAIVLVILTRQTEEKTDGPPVVEFSLKNYYDALLKRYRTLDLDALTPPQREEYLQLQLRSVFVEQSVRENPPPIELPKEILEKLQSDGELKIDHLPEGITLDEIRATGDQYYKNAPKAVIDVLTDSAAPHVVILGDPGSGKSTLTRFVILSLVDPDGDERLRSKFPDFLPILVELRTFNALREEGKCDTFLEFLEFLGKTEGWNLTQAILRERLSTAGAIVIFDGLDEVFDPGDRAHLSHAIAGFAAAYPKAGIVVTSRIVGYQRKILTDAGFEHYTLQDLDREQVESFVRRWYELALAERPDDAKRRIARILHSFDQSTSVRQLAGNPMLLTIMAIIGKHQELPRERWKLYDHAASVLIEHWDVKRHMESINVEAPFIGEDDKKELLRRLAFRMQAGGAGLKGNYIHRDQLQKEFHDYLVERFTLTPDRATTISRSMIEQFRKRNFILSLYGASVYGFVHRAFLEYFCATAFTYKFEKAHEITIDQLAEQVFGAHWTDESWHEVLRLICGIVDERFAGKLISYLLTVDTSREEGKLAFVKIELVLRCLNEVRNTNSIVETTDLAMKVTLDTLGGVADVYVENLYDSSKKLLSAAKAIGTNWPNRLVLVRLLKQFRPSAFSWIYEESFGELVASVGNGLEEVYNELLAYARNEDPGLRALWPEALATGWRENPTVLPMLKQQMKDPVEKCRRTATRAFISHYADTDPDGVSLLVEVLKYETSFMGRYEALRYLSRNADSSLFPAFKTCLSDPSRLVRSTALRALKVSDELTFDVLNDLLVKELQEADGWFRANLYEFLAEKHHVDPRTRDLLMRAAQADQSGAVRLRILDALAKFFADDPQTWKLLQTRAQEDPDLSVTQVAEKLIYDREKLDAETV